MCETTGYRSNWYKEWFGDEYLTVYEHRDDEDARRLVNLISSNLIITDTTNILDVACGSGRHAILFAKITPYVFGIDLSKNMLSQTFSASKPPYFIRGDMRYLPFGISFDLVFSLFTSFGYFEDDSTNLKVAKEMSSVLHEDGDIVIDYLNPDYVIENLVPYGKRRAGELLVSEKRWISDERIHKMIKIDQEGENKVFFESVRLYSLKNMKAILSSAGIRVYDVYGEYDGSPFHKHSSRMILFGKKE